MKSFLLKSTLICFTYILLQYLFYFNTVEEFEINAPFLTRIKHDIKDIKNADIFTLGSSIEYMSHPSEKNKWTMSQKLQEYLPEYKIIAFSQPAFNIDLLNPLLKYLYKKTQKDKLYIVEFNWDQFSVASNKSFIDRTSDRLIYEDNIITTLYRPLSIFNYDFGVLSNKEFREQDIFFDGSYMGKFQELYEDEDENDIESNFRNKYMIKYLYKLDHTHEKIKSFKELIIFLKKNNIKAIFYLTPFDYQSCSEYFETKKCQSIIDNNIQYVIDILEESEVSYINLVKSLPTEYTASTPISPNGHLKAEGRDFIAKELAKYINLKHSKI